ncbi:MAG TPA: hypothetical protein VK698_39635 [Kofleriaceae bacterium]|nr:hypothetical protein [Kofleriaceae bacterium]
MSARKALYAALMVGGPHSPERSDRASARIDAYRAEIVAATLAEVDRLRAELARRTPDTYLAAAALIEDRACDADFTHTPQHIAGLREAVELLTRRAGEVR